MRSARNAGLDTLRALAITLVFAYHYQVFVSHEPTFGMLSRIGWTGVDLFFVLSGYLIANSLFATLARGQSLSLPAFYARRALRTWPAFWVVLAAYFLWPESLGGKTPPALWRFLSFTQNWQLQPGTAFSHAWSLCIEEQFYLLLPAVLIAAMRIGGGRLRAWALLITLVVAAIVLRAVLWTQFGREADGQISGYYPNLYYASLTRFDEFLPGVALALLRHFHPQAWQSLMQRGRALFWVGLLATLTMLAALDRYYYIDGYGYGFAMTAFGYSLLAASFAVLVASALSPASPLYRLRVPGAPTLALWSYSIYLTHKAVAHLLHEPLSRLPLSAGLMPLLIALAALAAGGLLYKAVEAPVLRLRERWVPESPANPENPAPVLGAARA